HLLTSRGHAGKANSGLIAVWPGANTQGAFDLGYSSAVTEALIVRRPDLLILADADPVGEDARSAHLLEAGFTVVCDMFLTKSAAQADLVLPRQSFAERDGTFTNGERRVQRFYTAQTPLEGTRPDWKIFADVGQLLGWGKARLSAAAVMQDITKNVSAYESMNYANLAKVEAQFPDVGSSDQYYGGTAYHNDGGLGVQWPTIAEKDKVTVHAAASVPDASGIKSGDLLVVPITELYNRKPAFRASEGLIGAHIPEPYIVFNPVDARRLGVQHDERVSVDLELIALEATVRVSADAPKGAVLLPRSLASAPALIAPQTGCTIHKVEVAADVSH
ncbi:MAG TPA: molybdopterin-dependent oxidoreductase, partial [Aggregatilineales bacterium]|nr:molybdopterin-dependent oxidoreductase [Aggregatilineales bacterium]